MTFKLTSAPPENPIALHAQSYAPLWAIWHRRFGHVGYSGLLKLLEKRLVDGLNVDLTSDRPDCIACTEAKMSRSPYGPSSKRFTRPGELTHVDLWGKNHIASINGSYYYLLMVDDATRHVTVEFLKTKDQTNQRIKNYMAYLKAREKTPCAIRMDRGTEFDNADLRTWCDSLGIKFQETAPYSPSQNGVAERMNRTLGELARTMLTDSKMPEFLWELAVRHAAYVRNMSYTRFIPSATPYQLWNNKKPNVAHLREFGAPVWILAQGQRIPRKMLPKSHRRAYVGHDNGSKSILYYNAATRAILTSRNFRFLIPSTPSPPEDIVIDGELEGERDDPAREGEPQEDTRSIVPQKRPAEEENDQPCRKTRGIRVDYRYLNDPFPDEEESGIAYIDREEVENAISDDECHSLNEAKHSPEWPEWEKAIHAELDQLKRMGTWNLVQKPHDVIPIANKFVFAKKRDKDGNLLKYKARLVAKGYAQRPGFDYVETHSPVVRLETIRAILAIAPTKKLYIQQLDIKGAYLNGKLRERVYMKQPEGYNDGTGRVCQLIKTLYGLKQAGREWNREFDSKLQKKGYVRLRSDPCVYMWREDDDFVTITVWVDDMLLFATTIQLKNKAKADIESEWEVTDLGTPTKIVGIELAITNDAISISSSQYIRNILNKE